MMMTPIAFKQSLVHLPSLEPVYALARRCEAHDGYPFKNYWHILQERYQDPHAIDFLALSEGNLVGVVNIFFFTGSVEIVPYIDPAFRHQGLARKLLNITFTKLRQYIVPNYSFILHESCHALIEKCQQRGGQYDHLEVEMLAPTELPHLEAPEISLKLSETMDIPQLAIIHEHSFGQPDRQQMEERFAVALNEPHRKIWLVYNAENEVVGKLHLREDFNRIVLHDIGILPEFRQKNYGKALMLTWLKQFAQNYTKPIAVEVLGDNAAALRLYERCGFRLTHRYQFWRFPFK